MFLDLLGESRLAVEQLSCAARFSSVQENSTHCFVISHPEDFCDARITVGKRSAKNFNADLETLRMCNL